MGLRVGMMVQYALKKCSPGRIYHFHAARKYRLAACRAWFFAFASALGLFQGISLSRATTGAAADEPIPESTLIWLLGQVLFP